jgi:DNA mismatch repair ATPase MutS
VPPRFDHPFALDLDLVGERSLHQLVDTAVSLEGSQRLRDWLLTAAPDPASIQKRQMLVQELTPMSLFRDKLRLNAALVAQKSDEKWPGQRLLDWLTAQKQNGRGLRSALLLLFPLSLVNGILLLFYLAGQIPPWWVVIWLPFAAISVFQLRQIGPVFQEAFFLQDGLEQLRAVFDFLEGYRYGRSSHLKELCRPFWGGEKRPSQQLKQISRIVAAISLQKNPFVWLTINALLPWDLYFVYRLRQQKKELSQVLPIWLDILAELEALNSLANLAYLNPGFLLPQLVDTVPVLFQAQALGHPLIPDHSRVSNDFTLNQTGAVDIITGSNMAGKSSFLRTIGINLSLAFAGGPVCAASLQTTLFRLYTSMRIADSVTDGFSYFYAEVQRLKALLDALHEEQAPPLFFLIDEIFRGTNNRERLIGSRAYVAALAGGNGVGIIATHDLDLVTLADSLPDVTNYHFRDDVRNGRMIFDYKLHPGPCPTTNALKIMQLAQLPVNLPA